MASQAVTTTKRKFSRGRRLRGVLILLMGCLAVAAPFFAGSLALFLVGLLLIASGVLEMLETFQAPDEDKLRSAYVSGSLSILAGIVLLAQPQVVLRGLTLLLAGSFLVDGISKMVAAWRARVGPASAREMLAGGLVNVVLGLVLVFRWPISGLAVVEILVGIRMLSAGWSMLLGREHKRGPVAEKPLSGLHPDRGLNLPPHLEFEALETSLQNKEEGRRRIDAYWCWIFVVVFFAIHIGRMKVEWNLVGMVSPLVAVLGDVGTALLLAFGIILPYRLAWRKLTHRVERRGWEHLLARLDQGRGPGRTSHLYRGWLVGRLRFSRRLAKMRHSPRTALRWGLQVGLPLTAILIAVNPIWGFSWFFNSESWATEVWDRWAAARTDTWREQMVWPSRRATGKGTSRTTACSESIPKVSRGMGISASWCSAIQAKAVPPSTACVTSICSSASGRTSSFW